MLMTSRENQECINSGGLQFGNLRTMRQDKNNKYANLIAKDKLSSFTFGLRRPTISFIISTMSLITFSIEVFNSSKEKQTTNTGSTFG